MRDLRRLLTLPAVLVVLVGVLLAAGGLARAQSSQALTALQRADFERWWDAQPKIDMPFENDGAKVLIVEFTDLQCPFCRQKYIELKPVLDKYAERPKDVKFLMRHWPINTACNQVSQTLHPSACEAAAAAVMARRKGTTDTLVDWLFLH